MKRENALKLASFVLFLFLFGIAILLTRELLLAGMEKKIIQDMRKANDCTTSNDCALVSYSCPFGCGSYINKGKTAKISKSVSFYFKLRTLLRISGCVYDCATPVTPVCESDKCVPRSCELNVEYKSHFPDNCSCPQGSQPVIMPLQSGQGFFKCIADK